MMNVERKIIGLKMLFRSNCGAFFSINFFSPTNNASYNSMDPDLQLCKMHYRCKALQNYIKETLNIMISMTEWR